MKTFRLALLGSVVAGIGSMAAIDASAADVEKNVKMYGHVNRMIGFEDDGNSTEIRHLDNSIASSRFGIRATAKSANVTIGALFEWQFQSNSNGSGVPSQQQGSGVGGNTAARHSDISFATKYGTLFIGRGDSASNSIQTADLSGTGLAMAVGEPLSQSMGFTNTNNGGVANTTGTGGSMSQAAYQVRDLIPNIDGNSRTDRVRYNTPRFGGFMAAVSNDGGGRMAYQLNYGGAFFGFKIKAAVGHANNSSVTAEGINAWQTNTAGSISVLHDSGVSVTFAMSENNTAECDNTSGVMCAAQVNAGGAQEEGDRRQFYGKLGYQRDFTSLGKTYMAVDYNLGYDGVTDGDFAAKLGVGVIQKLSAYGTELYAVYEHVQGHRGDRRGAANFRVFDRINAGYFGARVKW